MALIPKPLRLKLAALEPPYRHHDCRFYRICLDTACMGRWESWSCSACEAFEPAVREMPSNNRGQEP